MCICLKNRERGTEEGERNRGGREGGREGERGRGRGREKDAKIQSYNILLRNLCTTIYSI